jgi:sugar-phosphatase
LSASGAPSGPAFQAHAIVFDCDGVLVDSFTSVERCWRAWAASLGLDGDDVMRTVHGQPSRATAVHWLPSADVDSAVALIDRMELDDAVGVTTIPGAADLLASLPAGFWGIATSAGRPLFQARMRAAGLQLPTVTVTADDVARGKPHPDPYAAALRGLGVAPDHAIVLEDSVAGIRAARAAGVRWVIRVGTGEPAVGEDLVVPDLSVLRWVGDRLVAGVWEEKPLP